MKLVGGSHLFTDLIAIDKNSSSRKLVIYVMYKIKTSGLFLAIRSLQNTILHMNLYDIP